MQNSASGSKDIAKAARIEIKTSPQVKSEIEKAAAISGVTLTSFIINLAHNEAKRIAAEADVVRLNQQAWQALNDLIDNPPEPTSALKDLMQSR